MELVGEKFYRLTVLEKKKNTKHMYLCQCDCGKVISVKDKEIRNKVSCGCHRKHGMSKTKLYKAWNSIKYRCNNAYGDSYWNYKDVNMCDEWANDFTAFRDWAYGIGYEETDEFNLRIYRDDYAKDYDGRAAYV